IADAQRNALRDEAGLDDLARGAQSHQARTRDPRARRRRPEQPRDRRQARVIAGDREESRRCDPRKAQRFGSHAGRDLRGAQRPRRVVDSDLTPSTLLRSLERATVRIGNAASPDELFDLVLQAAHEAVTYESASLMPVDAAGDALIVRASRPGR